MQLSHVHAFGLPSFWIPLHVPCNFVWDDLTDLDTVHHILRKFYQISYKASSCEPLTIPPRMMTERVWLPCA